MAPFSKRDPIDWPGWPLWRTIQRAGIPFPIMRRSISNQKITKRVQLNSQTRFRINTSFLGVRIYFQGQSPIMEFSTSFGRATRPSNLWVQTGGFAAERDRDVNTSQNQKLCCYWVNLEFFFSECHFKNIRIVISKEFQINKDGFVVRTRIWKDRGDSYRQEICILRMFRKYRNWLLRNKEILYIIGEKAQMDLVGVSSCQNYPIVYKGLVLTQLLFLKMLFAFNVINLNLCYINIFQLIAQQKMHQLRDYLIFSLKCMNR